MVSGLQLRNARVIDVQNGKILPLQDILIEGHLIKEMRRTGDEIPSDIHTIDLQGKFVAPGFWECHAHLADLTASSPVYRRKIQNEHSDLDPEDWDRFVSERLMNFLKYGITCIRDVGGPLDGLQRLKGDIGTGKPAGPEIFFAGPMLEKSPPAWSEVNQDIPGFTQGIDSTDDADRIVRDLQAGGAHLVKTFNKFDVAVYVRLLRNAEHAGLPVTHDPGTPLFHMIPMDLALDLGVRCFEHSKSPLPVVLREDLKRQHDGLMSGSASDSERKSFQCRLLLEGERAIDPQRLRCLAEKMITCNAYFCPTLSTLKDMKNPPEPAKCDEDASFQYRVMNGFYRMNSVIMSDFIRYKVPMLVGHDGWDARMTIREMELMQDAGMPASEIVKGATIYPSRWLGIDRLYGSIDRNKTADLVVFDRNPLDDIRYMDSVSAVISRGQVVFFE